MFADRHFTPIGIFKIFVITVLLLATMIFGAGYVYVNQAGGLRRLLESELSRMVGNGAASVGDARLNFSLSRRPLQLAAEKEADLALDRLLRRHVGVSELLRVCRGSVRDDNHVPTPHS